MATADVSAVSAPWSLVVVTRKKRSREAPFFCLQCKPLRLKCTYARLELLSKVHRLKIKGAL